jgi:hypothetical protein
VKRFTLPEFSDVKMQEDPALQVVTDGESRRLGAILVMSNTSLDPSRKLFAGRSRPDLQVQIGGCLFAPVVQRFQNRPRDSPRSVKV